MDFIGQHMSADSSRNESCACITLLSLDVSAMQGGAKMRVIVKFTTGRKVNRIKFHCPPFASFLCNGFRTLQCDRGINIMEDLEELYYLKYSGHAGAVLPGPIHRAVTLWGILPRRHALVQLIKVWKIHKWGVFETLAFLWCTLTSGLFKGGNLVVWRESVQRSDQRGLSSRQSSQGQGACGREAFKLQDLFRLFPEAMRFR